ncbi:MAG: CBS domain-containing protein [Myxococcota bacterium]
MRTIADWMARDPMVVLEDAPLSTAAALLIHHHYRHLPVIGPTGRLVALLDDSDVFARGEWVSGEFGRSAGSHPAEFSVHDPRDATLRAADVARQPEIVVRPIERLKVAVRPMIELGVDCAVAVDDDRRPVGILTAYDLVRHAPSVLPEALTTRDLAARQVVTVGRGQSVGAALDTMRAHRVRHLVVTEVPEGGGGPRPCAVLSWRALMEVDAVHRPTRALATLDAVRSGAVESVHDGARLHEIAERMVSQKVGCLPVVSADGRMIGIVSRSDLMRAVLAELD